MGEEFLLDIHITYKLFTAVCGETEVYKARGIYSLTEA